MLLVRTLIMVCFLLAFEIASAQELERKYFFKEVGWTISLPADFKTIDSVDNLKRMERGVKAIEKANNIDADASSTRTLISATKNKYNYFNVTLTPFNTMKEGNWEASNQKLKDLVYKTMEARMGNAKLDSSSSNEFIDGLKFSKFHVSAVLNNEVKFDMFILVRFHKGFDLGVTYLSLDDRTRQQIESMLKNSRFNKNSD